MTAATRVEVPASAHTYLPDADYADSFRLGSSSPASAEALTRLALEGMPAQLRLSVRAAHRYLLGLQPGPDDAQHVLGWPILQSSPDLLVLGAQSRMVDCRIVVATGDGGTSITTLLHHRHPATRIIWAGLGFAHRTVAPYLLSRTARLATKQYAPTE